MACSGVTSEKAEKTTLAIAGKFNRAGPMIVGSVSGVKRFLVGVAVIGGVGALGTVSKGSVFRRSEKTVGLSRRYHC